MDDNFLIDDMEDSIEGSEGKTRRRRRRRRRRRKRRKGLILQDSARGFPVSLPSLQWHKLNSTRI